LLYDGGARWVVAEGDIALAVHRRAAHPTPSRVGLIGALLEDRHRPRGHVTQLEPAYAGHAARTHRVVPDHRLVITEITIRQTEHQTVANPIESRSRAGLRHAGAGRGAERREAGRGRAGKEREGGIARDDEGGVEVEEPIGAAARKFDVRGGRA